MSVRYFLFGNSRFGGAYDFLAGTSNIKDALSLGEEFVLEGINVGVHVARGCPDGELEIILELLKVDISSVDHVDPSCLDRFLEEFGAHYRGWAWLSYDSQQYFFPGNDLVTNY